MPRSPFPALLLAAALLWPSPAPAAHGDPPTAASSVAGSDPSPAAASETTPDADSEGADPDRADPDRADPDHAEDDHTDDDADRAAPISAVVRLVASGRVGAGLLVRGGTHALTILRTVHVGYPAAVLASDGRRTRGRIEAWDRLHGIALLALDEPLRGAPEPTFADAPLAPGDALVAIGHGGSVGLSVYDVDLGELAPFSRLPTEVVAVRAQTPEEAEGRVFPDMLVDRAPGDGDVGAPLHDARGAVVGLLREAVPGGGGRALAVPASPLVDLLAAPADRRYRRPSHLQSFAGVGLAAHNRPTILAALVLVGARIAILDALRLEPFVEADLGARAPHTRTDADGATTSRPLDLAWSVEAGLNVGYRAPLRAEGSRNYIVPNLGLRLGWARFEHRDRTLAATCPGDGACVWTTRAVLDQERTFRAGLDLGLDVRHGRVRLGYRFFLDPRAPATHAMHRLFVTVDGLPLNLAVGDTR